MNSFHRFAYMPVIGFVLCNTICINAVGSGYLRTVALSGRSVPGVGDASFSGFSTPDLNNNGETAFRGAFTGIGISPTNDAGIFSDAGGTGLELVARKGNAAAGTGNSGIGYSELDAAVLNNAGQVAFAGRLSGPGVTTKNDQGIYVRNLGSVPSTVIREGDAAPHDPANSFVNLGTFLLNDRGQIAFTSRIFRFDSDPNQPLGIFRGEGSSGDVVAVLVTGQPVAELGNGVILSGLQFGMQFNDLGQVVFLGSVSGPGIGGFENRAVFRGNVGGGAQLIAREQDSAPGMASGVTISGLNSIAIDKAGQIAFATEVDGGTDDFAIFAERNGTIVPLVVDGQTITEVSPGITLGAMRTPAINTSGGIAFDADLVGPGMNSLNRRALFVERESNEIELVAWGGGTPPGVEPGVTYGSIAGAAINSKGQVMFVSILQGDADPSNNIAIFAQDQNGKIELIVREGGTLDVSDDPLTPDLRTVDTVNIFSFTSNEDGLPSSFNDRGQVAFYASFTDGSHGIFVDDSVAVAEPTSAIYPLAIAVVALTTFKIRPLSSSSARRLRSSPLFRAS